MKIQESSRCIFRQIPIPKYPSRIFFFLPLDNIPPKVYILHIHNNIIGGEFHMDIIISNASGVPIYEQIEEQIKSMIMTGDLAAGDALPSMRLLAKELRISVITTKRAYEDLERDGFIESVVGKGSFVKGINSDLMKESMLFAIEEGLEKAVDKAILGKVSLSEMQQMLSIIYEEKKNG